MNSSHDYKKQNQMMQSLEARPMKREPLIQNQSIPSESYGVGVNSSTKLPSIVRNSSRSQLDLGADNS